MMQATCYKTVAAWNMTYRQREGFPDPDQYEQCGNRPLPQLLETFPDAKDEIASFAIKIFAKLTIEGVHNFIVSKVIPRLITVWQSANNPIAVSAAIVATTSDEDTTTSANNEEDPKHSFLVAHGLESLSLTTAWRWMCLLAV
jgi:hypothetical protein